MKEKDYYTILNLTRQSSTADIKRSFRQLAMRYHPDKNANNQEAAQLFREIHDAYRVLSHSARRAAYDQQRWYAGNQSRKPAGYNDSPMGLLQKVQKLDRYIERMQGVSVDGDALTAYVARLFAGEGWRLLVISREQDLKRLVLKHLLSATAPLSLLQLNSLLDAMKELAEGDLDSLASIQATQQQRQRSDRWDTLRIPIIVLIAVLICLLIFLVSD